MLDAADAWQPEQLFALGYSSCFLSALQLVAREGKVKLPGDVKVKATVKIGPSAGNPGFALAVDIGVSGPSHACPRALTSSRP